METRAAQRARRRARRAYELAHVRAASRTLAIGMLPALVAVGLHGVSRSAVVLAAVLAITIAVFAWTGGPWRRGARTGVLAGVLPLLAPLIVFSLAPEHCAQCVRRISWPCIAACFGTSTWVGIALASRARRDVAPRSFAFAALVTSALTGLLGCGLSGIGGTIGIGLGVALGTAVGFSLPKPATNA